MKQFMEPEVKLTMFWVEDVITTSSEDDEGAITPCANETPVG